MKWSVVVLLALQAFAVCKAVDPQLPRDNKNPDTVKTWSEDKALFIASELIVKVRKAEEEAIRFIQSVPMKPKDETQFGLHDGPLEVMRFLGTIRSVKAVPLLCDRLLWEKLHDSLVGNRTKYPTAGVLAEIGTPAVKGLLSKVAGAEVGQLYRRVTIDVMVDVLGEGHVVKCIDDFKLDDQAVDADGRKRLDVLKQQFKDLYKIK